MSQKLAIKGGSPLRASFLSFHSPWLGKEEEEEILHTLRSGWLTTGPKTQAFEEQFARYVGAEYAVGVNSCTAALHLALIAAGIGPGDEVITTPITFPATANVIVHVGAKPIFVDIDLRTLNIDPNKIEPAITPRTKGIIPVHFAGQPCDMDPIMFLAQKYNLAVIEDAAHAIETVYRGKKVGSIGLMTAFSFYATKNITTGEGGMLSTNDAALAEKAAILRLHGISRDAWKRYSDEGYKHWETIYPGFKYNMFDIQAALGLQQLKKIEFFWQKRKEYVERYNRAFQEMPGIIPLEQIPGENCRNAYYLYVILVKSELLKADRDVIMNALQAENIGIGIHFRALHLQPYYKNTFGFKKGDFPLAEYASDRVLSLPLYPKMSEDDVEDVILATKKVIGFYLK